VVGSLEGEGGSAGGAGWARTTEVSEAIDTNKNNNRCIGCYISERP
jgi:hypothetical protein